MKALWFFIKKLSRYKLALSLGLLFSLLLSAASVALLSLSGWFISAAAFAGLTTATAISFNFFLPAAIIRFLALIKIGSRYAERVINHDFTFKILTTLRVWFYKALLPLSPNFLIRHRSGELLNNLIQDIETLDHLYLRILSPVLVALITSLAFYFFLHFYSLSIAYFLLSILLTTLIILPTIAYVTGNQAGEALIKAQSELRTNTIDFLQGFLPLLFYVKKAHRLDAIKQSQDNLSAAQKRMASLKGFTNMLLTIFSGAAIVGVLVLGIPLVHQAALTGAQLAMILLGVIIVFEQLMSLPAAFLSIGKTEKSANKLYDIAHQTPLVSFPEKSESKCLHADLLLNNVSFQYPSRKKPSISNLNLILPEGEKLLITGESGAGKTTLMHLLTRCWDQTSGEIHLDKLPLASFSAADLRSIITTVPQRIHIFNTTIKENLTLMQADISAERISTVIEAAGLTDLIASLPSGINTQMGEFGKRFSGGQIRRIGIARALLTNAKIHIWDEPSTGLNHMLFEEIWNKCNTLLQGKTLIIISHNKVLKEKINRHITL